MSEFIGSNLRLLRLFNNLSLTELGEQVNVSKQFLSRIESGAQAVSTSLENALAETLNALPDFFYQIDSTPIAEDQCHFRSQLTTKIALRQVAKARGEMLKRFVAYLDSHIKMPAYKINEANPSSAEEIERASEKFRADFALGNGPLSNVTRIAENAGAIVMKIPGLAPEIDAISFATKRPVIALNTTGRSACRERFGIAHEIGHLSLHIGVITGDRSTESQANRFASALLLPRNSFAAECGLAIRGSRLNWPGLAQLKLRWGTSKAAILFRGRQLGIFTDAQARAGYIGLTRHGEALQENEDALISHEEPEIVTESLTLMREKLGIPEIALARALLVQPKLLRDLLGTSSAWEFELDKSRLRAV